MRVAKVSLVAMLSESGEENAAVLLARSDVPDDVDTERDVHLLAGFGLEPQQIDELVRMAVGPIPPDDADSRRIRDQVASTISHRWADLVDTWAAPPR